MICEDEHPGPRLSVRASGFVICLLSAGSWYEIWTGGKALLNAL